MYLLDLTLKSAAGNLALDEALLEWAESGGGGSSCGREVLRLWESPGVVAVVGRSSRVAEEVNVEFCQRRNIPVLRRPSGGAAVVAGPGCLMYCLILDLDRRPELRLIDRAHQEILARMRRALLPIDNRVVQAGTSDLAYPVSRSPGEALCKFSGNSVRVRRHCLLYHGTILYDFDLPLIGEVLRVAPRQPDYRARRDHLEFVANLPAPPQQIRQALISQWSATEEFGELPYAEVDRLVQTQYGLESWNCQR